MRVLFCFCFLIQFTFIGPLAAQNYLFSVGPVYSPFVYQNYNKSDWNNYPYSYPSGNSQINGSSIGLMMQIPISNKFMIKSGLNYSKQSQKHKSYTYILDAANNIFAYNSEIITKFNFISVPVYLSFSQEIGYKSDFYVNVSAGPQISFLTHYESTYIAYGYDYTHNVIIHDSIENYIHQESGEMAYQRIVESFTPNYDEYYYDFPKQFNTVLLGVSGAIELQKIVNDRFLFGLGVFSDYDFTNSETSEFYPYPSLNVFIETDPRPKSHNFRIGLTLTAQYVFY